MDALDRKIENLLQDWHQNPDMLFTIHPVDGSYLVWLVLSLTFLGGGDFCHLLITFANSLDPDQDRQNVGPDLDPNCLTL